jgi:hypothetical protein
MPRSVCRLALAVGVLASVAGPARAQATATYYLHDEVSATSGLRQLGTAGPHEARVAIPSADLKNQTPGPGTIASFDTETGVPDRGGVIAGGSTVTFTIWMKKTDSAGTVFPQASLGLNFPVTTSLCQATGTTALTTRLAAFTLSCTTTSPIVMGTADRLIVAAGYSMTVGPGNKNMRVRLDIEGRSTRSADSRVVAPNPVASTITSLTPNAGPVGATVTVAGSNFGPTQGASTLTLNGVTAAPTGWTSTNITAPVPPGTTTGPVIVTVGGVSSSGVPFTVIPTPSISSLTPAGGHANDPVTIAGANFGTTQGSSSVRFNGITAVATNWTNTSISASVPAGATSGPLVVTVSGVSSNGVPFSVIPPPSITSLTPSTGRVGDAVTIGGTNFGAAQGASAVALNGTLAAATSWSDTSVVVTVPGGASTGQIVIKVAGTSSNGATFTVIVPPSVTSVTPSTGRVGDPVVVAGANFGAAQGSSTVSFNGTGATPTGWSDTSISALVPVGATTGALLVTVGGQASNTVTFTVAAGTGSVEITSPADGAVVNPGQTLTVTVASADNSTFSKIVVLGEGGIGVSDAGSSLPAQVSLSIPADIDCRKYLLSVFGLTTSGLEVSGTIEIDVERPDMPASISAPMRQIIFEAAGETSSVDLLAHFPDGRVLAVRESSNVTYASSDPGVMTVGATGVVTAIAEGDADITATYGPPGAGISVRIPVSVPPAVFTVSPGTLDFGNQAIGTMSSQQMTVTNSSSCPLSIVSLTATGDFAETDNCVASSPLAPGAPCAITVTFGPTAAGPRTGAIGLESSFNLVPVVLGLTGTGVGP